MSIWPATDESIARAAERLTAGGLVAMPTETVYGLAANALDAAAVAAIFAAKGRPATNPVIVHVKDAAQAATLAEWTPMAQMLAERFWPGPLTLVLRKRSIVPAIVTAGGETVAVRCPNHTVALKLLKVCNFPLAAPSANRSTELSPTRAEHVLDAFGDVFPILDGGPCTVGLESTVLDISRSPARILRPGHVTAEKLRAVIGDVEEHGIEDAIARSPGMMAKHYSPRAKVMIMSREQIQEKDGCAVIRIDCDAEQFARELYRRLHDADRCEVQTIIVEEPPDTAEWVAVRDRLSRMGT